MGGKQDFRILTFNSYTNISVSVSFIRIVALDFKSGWIRFTAIQLYKLRYFLSVWIRLPVDKGNNSWKCILQNGYANHLVANFYLFPWGVTLSALVLLPKGLYIYVDFAALSFIWIERKEKIIILWFMLHSVVIKWQNVINFLNIWSIHPRLLLPSFFLLFIREKTST